MNEQISRLMDGDADEAEVERVCHGCATGPVMETWVCYHVIGDGLRGLALARPEQRAPRQPQDRRIHTYTARQFLRLRVG